MVVEQPDEDPCRDHRCAAVERIHAAALDPSLDRTDLRIVAQERLNLRLVQIIFSFGRGVNAKQAEGKRVSAEGHGFSHAAKGLPTTALAAAVRFSGATRLR
jgi:hypothetical protein